MTQCSWASPPLQIEGEAAHPDAYGTGFDEFASDEEYLTQLKAYAHWRGIKKTKQEQCSRPDLFDQL